MKIDAIALREEDNVATALRDIAANSSVLTGILDETRESVVKQDIPYGHKFALNDIRAGELIYKYGEVIGKASADIPAGTHAHVQNIESLRGRGDLAEG